MLKISVVTVCYNMSAFIEQTLLSVLSQNYPNLEYIVIDGGSTDGTQEIIERYRDRLAYYVSEPDKGMYDALNKGFSHATGDVLAWINADDVYLPGSFRTVDKVFSTFEQVEWINGRGAYLTDDGALSQVMPKNAIRTRRDIREGWCREDVLGFLMQEGMFWRRSLMQRTGALDTRYRYAGDFDLWVRFAQQADIYYVNVPLAAFRKRTTNLATVALGGYLEEVQAIIAGQKRYPNLLWRLVPRTQKRILNLLRMLRIRRGNLVYFSYQGDRLRLKRAAGSASAHTVSNLKTLF